MVSGPKANASQAATALAAAGLTLESTTQEHGLTSLANGEDIREAQAFITVSGEDVNAARQAVEPLGWCLRLHYPTPEPAAPGPDEQMAAELAALKAEIAILKAKVG